MTERNCTEECDAIKQAACAYIIRDLTEPQRRALVTSLVTYQHYSRVPMAGAWQHTVRALQRGGAAALVVQEGMDRYLTPLGVEVARYLITTGEWRVYEDAA
ncbi:hypothetical protein [Rhodococcus qingshengii]|uniref:hypothetical protein n=1 Tax=Rhodococcus qingshengii TaxID=334542 RepID=UPI0035DC65FC